MVRQVVRRRVARFCEKLDRYVLGLLSIMQVSNHGYRNVVRLATNSLSSIVVTLFLKATMLVSLLA
jgi:hypothetical protein